ncbi:hypothetical protein [Heyndrickxia sporothermodurans]
MSFFFFKQNTSFAKDITEGDKVQIVDKSTVVPSKYKFIAQFNKNKSKVIPFGLKADYITSKPPNSIPYVSFSPKLNSSLKGKFGVTYTNVGRYEDKEIDLKITIMDWESYITNDSGKISFKTEGIAENVQGYNFVDQKWEYYEHGTNKKIKINGYMTINDIDAAQGVKFDKSTSTAINSILVDSSTKGFLSYSKTNGEIRLFESNNIASETLDIWAMATVLYEELDTIRFKWERDYYKTANKPTKVYEKEYADGEYFGYIAKKPARTELLDPFKTIQVNDQESAEKLNISVDKTFKYNLYHQVPDEWEEFYYADYTITDTINNQLEIKAVKVLDEEEKDVTSLFDNKTSGNNIKFVAKKTSLKRSSFYNHTYKVVVEVKVKNSTNLSDAVKNGKVSFSNMFNVSTDKFNKKSNNVTADLYERKIDVWHISKIDQSTIEHTTDKLFDGDSYSYSSKENFKKGAYTYIPAPKENKKGVINGKDIELKFYYQLPLIDVNLKHIKIYTGNANKGLPVKLEITQEYPFGKDIPDLANNSIKIELYEKNSDKALISKEYKLNKIPTKIDDWIISKNLIKDTHKNYLVKILGVDNKTIASSHPEIDTDGYTASEKSFNVNAGDTDKISYKGVVMTEREVLKNMNVHYETLAIPVNKLPKKKTGYGFELKSEVTYQNDLATQFYVKVEALVDNRLIDSYLTYKQQENYNKVPLDQTQKSVSTDEKTTKSTFELPHVFVEQNTGYLFSDTQVRDNDSRIKYELKDGMRKIYTPIWSELGNYDVKLQSIDPIGVNEVTFKINDKLNLYAFMYATIDSKTLDDDEILIEPIDPRDPFPNGLPSGWTKSDLDWFKN